MIAVVSSTLTPSALPSHDGPRTNLDPLTRLEQTVASVCSLVALGAREIFIADNSTPAPSPETIAALAPARVFHFGHFPYRNKGVAEAFLLLALLPHLPANRPILKLSGRYRASLDLCAQLGDAPLAGLFTRPPGGVENLSTRAYAVREREFFARFLEGALDELYASPWRVVGPRSLLSVARRLLRASTDAVPYRDPKGSLEISAARWLARNRIAVRRLDQIGVEGVLGSWINPAVKE
jgi:hypothetical protein